MSIENYINDRYEGNPLWFEDEVKQSEHVNRVAGVLNDKDYLSGKHSVLQRQDVDFKGEVYEVRRIIFNTLKSLINFHSSYIMGKPISLAGSEEMVKVFNGVYRKGGYDKINFDIIDRILKYGECYEYIYYDGVKVTSRIINSEDGYPVYSEDTGEYIAFVEHYTVDSNKVGYFNVFYEDRVEVWNNKGGLTKLVETKVSFGLPIAYVNDENIGSDGISILNDLKPIIDEYEDIMSKLGDSIYTNCINPLLVSIGSAPVVPDGIDADATGYIVNVNEGDLKYVTATIDTNAVKEYLNNLKQQLYDIAQVPSAIYGGSNIANVSEVALKLLFISSDNKANAMKYLLDVGMDKRHDIMERILSMLGVKFGVDEYVEPIFNYSRPMSDSDVISNLSTMYADSVIDKKTYLELAPNIVDVDMVYSRLGESRVGITEGVDANVE